jgi:hypothetical protein
MYSRKPSCWFLILHAFPFLYCPCCFNFASCSRISLLQLCRVSCILLFRRSCSSLSRGDVLSAGEEAALLGHLVAVLALRGYGPGHADDAGEDEADDGGVALPVGGLRIPTTGRRPDVLGVPVRGQTAGGRGIGGPLSRDLSSSAHCEVLLWRFLGWVWRRLDLSSAVLLCMRCGH